MTVSVIIPIYNVSRFIERCAESLMQQTLDGVEYIFVNDATPDDSIALLHGVLERYPGKAAQVKIIEHEQNKGLPAARNTGLAVATGEYVFHCDSDDFVEPTMLEALYNAAKGNCADYVWCDWFLSYDNNERYMPQPSFDKPMEALKAMLSGGMKYNVWNKLVRRSLYVDNGITFPAGYGMGEDMTMMRLVACATKVACVNKALYHYVRSNTEAMTQAYSERHMADVLYNVNETIKFLEAKGVASEADVALFKLNVKLPFLITDDWNSYRRWSEWFPEANAYISENKGQPFRTRFLQQMAAKKIYAGVWMYYQVIYRFLYTILYK